MRKDTIIQTAIENLKRSTGYDANWNDNPFGKFNGVLTIYINGREIAFVAEVKQEFRLHQIEETLNRNRDGYPLLIIATKLFPKIKEHLRVNHIAYLETNGNVYIEQNDILIRIDGEKPFQNQKEKANRAFTKAGVKLLFLYLTNQEWLNRPYREVAKEAKVALGTIPPIIEALKKLGYLTKIDEKTLLLVNKEELVERWVTAYGERLKPGLYQGKFRLDENDRNNWKKVDFHDEDAVWGGEPAADLLTNYLNPVEFTIYTTLKTTELIKKLRFLPDENGYATVYNKFWTQTNEILGTAPPLIIYADLKNTNDNRNIETANMIYERFLKDI